MGLSNSKGQVRILLAVLVWVFILWLFTIGNPGFLPIAKFIIAVFVIPYALVEWAKEKQWLTKHFPVARIVGLLLGGVVWHFFIR